MFLRQPHPALPVSPYLVVVAISPSCGDFTVSRSRLVIQIRALCPPVVLLVENPPARVQPTGDQRLALIGESMSGHPTASDIVGRPRRRAGTKLRVVRCLAGLRIPVMRARLPVETRLSTPIHRVTDRRRTDAAVYRRRGPQPRLSSTLTPERCCGSGTQKATNTARRPS